MKKLLILFVLSLFGAGAAFSQNFAGHYGEIVTIDGNLKDRGIVLEKTTAGYSGTFYMASPDGTGQVTHSLTDLLVNETTGALSFKIDGVLFAGSFVTSHCLDMSLMDVSSATEHYRFDNRKCQR